MQPESTDLADYLAITDVIDADHPAVRRRAQELVDGAADVTDKAKRLFEWVRDEVPHTADINGQVVTCRASEVLERGTGICYAKSHLLAALCRSVSVPAGFCYQRLRKDPPHEGYELHGFNAVYLAKDNRAGAGRWVWIDARGNKRGVDARFSLDEERLAFPIDPDAGEVTYPTIWIAPAPSVVQTLQRYDRVDEMWPNLPDSI